VVIDGFAFGLETNLVWFETSWNATKYNNDINQSKNSLTVGNINQFLYKSHLWQVHAVQIKLIFTQNYKTTAKLLTFNHFKKGFQ